MAISITPDLVPAPAPQQPPRAATATKPPHVAWKAIAPVAVTLAIALLPPPGGLAPHAWYFFAIFAGVIVALMLEPLPGAAVGVLGVTLVTVLAPYVLYGPAELAKPGFNAANSALGWALSGFANGTVWLIFAAFMFALGYDRTGLGKRISLVLVRAMGRRTLTLVLAVLLLVTAVDRLSGWLRARILGAAPGPERAAAGSAEAVEGAAA